MSSLQTTHYADSFYISTNKCLLLFSNIQGTSTQTRDSKKKKVTINKPSFLQREDWSTALKKWIACVDFYSKKVDRIK